MLISKGITTSENLQNSIRTYNYSSDDVLLCHSFTNDFQFTSSSKQAKSTVPLFSCPIHHWYTSYARGRDQRAADHTAGDVRAP
jgi:hypothetical protein